LIAARHCFADRESLAKQLANDVVEALRQAIAAKGSAIIAVSGGSTPKLFFEELSGLDVDWAHVTVTLIDERQVPETSERSNARLVRQHLLNNQAVCASFVPLYGNPAAASLPPFDVAVLGMGADGHTASFFPNGDRLSEALDIKAAKRLIAIEAPGAGEPRLTFTLPALLEARLLCLHIEGEDKRRVLKEALKDCPVEAMPIRAVLRAEKPVSLYWCK
jgi:6-phosphogluconolactonase